MPLCKFGSVALLVGWCTAALAAPGTFSLLSWNVYQQGTQQKGGYEMIISELVRLKPDLAVLVEVRNYGKKDWLAQVVADLKARGETYYTHWSEGAGVLSRTPFEDSVIWPGPRGNVRKAKTVIDGHSVVLYAGHLDASYCAYYKVYPYAGKQLTEAERAAAITDILKSNVTSDRDNMAYAFLNDARTEFANSANILFCGDFNETSHLDWTEETKHLRCHNGFVIPWTVSMALAGDGYTDAYRKAFPNPVTHPGNTYPSAMPGIDPKRIAWDKGDAEKNAKAVQRVRHDYAGPGVEVVRFGGEGTGGRAMAQWPWRVGQRIRYAVSTAPGDAGETAYTGWIWDEEKGAWFRIATFSSRVNSAKSLLTGCYSFVEDFLRNGESRNHVRKASFGMLWSYGEQGWQAAGGGSFSGDANTLTTIDCGTSGADI